MGVTLFTGLYIYKNYDPYSDGVFKSILQLNIDENGNLYMSLLNGFLRGFGFDITDKELETNFIPIRSFLDKSVYVGYNAFRMLTEEDDISDLNFTGYVDEETGVLKNHNELYDSKLQIILYKDDNNMLMYYDTDMNKSELDETFRLRFINSKYVNDTYWCCFEDYRNLYIDKEAIMMDLYSIEGVESKQMIFK